MKCTNDVFVDRVERLPVLRNLAPPTELSPGWQLYDAAAEYARFGVGTYTQSWRVSTANRDYSMCETYSKFLAVPRNISDQTLLMASKFRSKHRIPILSYFHTPNAVRFLKH